MTDYLKKFQSCFRSLAQKHDGCRAFSDFVDLASIAIRQSIHFDTKEEKRYLELIKQYSREEAQVFPELLAIVTCALEKESCDFLGSVFHALELNSKEMAQYFTPYDISRFIGRIVFSAEDATRSVKEDGYLTVNDPCCGAGGFLIASAETFKELNFNPHTQLLVTGEDISHVAVGMTYIQLSLLGIPAIVSRRNTITQENFCTHYTPMFFWQDWPNRIKRSRMKNIMTQISKGKFPDPQSGNQPNCPVQPFPCPIPFVESAVQMDFDFY